MAKKSIALVTGASSGIGLAIAKALAQRSYDLLLISNDEMGLAEAAIAIKTKYAVEIHLLFMDLSQQDAAKKIFEFCIEQQLEVEVLVNNAGILLFGEFAAAGIEKTERILNLHMHTPALLCAYFSKAMMRKKKGFILNISSISAVMPYPSISLYGPTKTFLRYFTRAIRTELAPYGIHVCCAMPGATATALYDPKKVNLRLAMQLGVMKTSEFVAEKTVNAMFNNKAVVIPGLMNKLVVLLFPLIPHVLLGLIYRNTSIFKKGKESLG